MMTTPLSQGHDASVKAKPTVIRPFGDNVAGWPDGFMFSSVKDLARFAIVFLDSGKIDGKQVLTTSVITKLSTPFQSRLTNRRRGLKSMDLSEDTALMT